MFGHFLKLCMNVLIRSKCLIDRDHITLLFQREVAKGKFVYETNFLGCYSCNNNENYSPQPV